MWCDFGGGGDGGVTRSRRAANGRRPLQKARAGDGKGNDERKTLREGKCGVSDGGGVVLLLTGG